MKKRIFSYFVYVITIAVIATMALMAAITYRLFEQRVVEDLEINARVIMSLLHEDPDGTELSALGEVLRITVIRADGTVYEDNLADPSDMENHAARREVALALKNGWGVDVRNSQTLARSTFYYAVRMDDGNILRVAKETSSIWSVYLSAVPVVLLVMAVFIGLCIGLANMLTRRLLTPIEQMTAHLSNVSGVTRYPELEPFMQMIQKQHEEILRSANMRVEFTANVSHELKTPLTSISGYAELIESGMAQGEQVGHFAGEIHKSANRLLTLINDIIRLSQMDAPMPDIKFEPVELSQVAASVAEQLKLSAQKMEVAFQLETRPALVSADKRMMEELIYNLCDNAIRYNVRGGSVKVQVRPLQEQVILCVQDTGIGISQEHQAHIFERFYRVDKSRSKATGGTGLGLAIVKHIAAKHQAQIRIESELGRGTSIEVIFARFHGN